MNDVPLKAVLDQLSSVLRQRYGERFAELWLYSSQARGEASPESDIDLLLVLTHMERSAQEIDHIIDILADFNLRYGVLLSVLPVARSTFRTATGPFWGNVRTEGIAA